MHGRLEELDGRWQVQFTRRLPHPAAKVWRALTEPEHLKAWFPTTVEGERAPGAPLRFAHRDGAAPPFDGEMITYEPPSVLEFRWGPDTLRFELQADADGTLLTLRDTLDELGKAARDAAGWHVCLDQLESHLAGDDEDRTDLREGWQPVHAWYVEHFSPEASTIGPPEPPARS
jgi:uncharacterized protein YndB with AHSA1/START domain